MSANRSAQILAALAQGAPEPPAAVEKDAPPRPKAAQGQAKRRPKHIGGYIEPETVERFALLRLRLDLDNSQLITRAIDELYQRETARRAFGD